MSARRANWIVGIVAGVLLAPAMAGAAAAAPARTGAGSAAPQPAQIKATITVPEVPREAVTFGGQVYVLSENREVGKPDHSHVVEIDPATNAVVRTLDLGLAPVADTGLPGALAAGAGALWVSDFQRNVLDRIDPTTMSLVARIPTGLSPSGVVFAFGSVWVAHQHDARLWRFDPVTNTVLARIPVDAAGTYDHGNDHVSADSTGILETVGSRDVVVRVSPTTNQVTKTYHVAPAFDCGQVLPVPGGFWLDDSHCSQELYHYGYAAQSIVGHFTASGCIYSASVIDGNLYAATSLSAPPPDFDCVDIAIQKIDPLGDVTQTRVLPHGFATVAVQPMFGDFWVEVFQRSVDRIAAF